MESALSYSRARTLALPRWDAGAAGAWTLAFALVAYLGLRGGGYDAVVRGEVGVAVWWVLLMGALAGVLPATRIGRTGWVAIGLLAGFAGWTALGLTWTSSAERSVAEVARMAMHLGVLVLALAVLRPDTARQALHGVGAAVALVAGLSVASRLWPASFPTDQAVEFFGPVKRLNYPLNYSDGLASFVAIGLPVLLGVASSARTIAGRALAAAALPVLALSIFLSASRGGVLAVVVGLAAFLAIVPDRLPKLATALVAGVGSAVVIAAVDAREALRDGLPGGAAGGQAGDVLVVVLLACAGVALVQAAIALADLHAERPRWMVVSRRRALAAVGVVLACAAVVAVAAGVPGEASDRWQEFKNPTSTATAPQENLFDRLSNLSGSRRYQYWAVGVDAFERHPVRGIGPGTFEFTWLQDGTPYEFVRDAHSLFVETLAELGVVGLALLLAAFGWFLAAGVRGATRGDPERRVVAAAAVAGIVAFAGGAAFNWTWEITVVPVTALILAAVAIHAARPARLLDREAAITRGGADRAFRVAAGVLAVAALAAVVVPLAATDALRGSQAAARQADPATALARADQAARLQPYAASPALQRGLVLESAGALGPAAAALRDAIAAEPRNWRLWLTLSRVEARRGRAEASVAAYRRARALNPGSPVFAR